MAKLRRTKVERLYEAANATVTELFELTSDLAFEDDSVLLAHARVRWPTVVEALTGALAALATARARRG